MIIEDLTHDDIHYIIEHLQAACACRVDCIGCHYVDDYGVCTLRSIPAEWRPEAIKERGDQDDQSE